MSEVPVKKYKFSVSWIIEDILFCPVKGSQMLRSPPFTVGILGRTTWRLVIFPRGLGAYEHSYVGCFLYRESEDKGPDKIMLDYRFILNCSASQYCVLETFNCVRFSERDYRGCSRFVAANHLTEAACCGKKFHIRCDLSPCDDFTNISNWNDQTDMEGLSLDLRYFHESSLMADITLRGHDCEFGVHKAILAARAPKLLEQLSIGQSELADSIATDISMSVLRTLLRYIYSGKTDVPLSGLETELFTVSKKYGLGALLDQMRTFSNFCTIQTCMKLEYKAISWTLRDFLPHENRMSLVRIVPSEFLCDRDLIMRCEIFKRRNRIERVDVSFSLDVNRYPVFLSCKITAVDVNFTTWECFCGSHLFENNSEWSIPDILNLYNDNLQSTAGITFNFSLDICDGYQSNVKASGAVFDQTPSIIDYTQLRQDLCTLFSTKLYCDFIIISGGESISVHKSIMSARSPVFRKMLEHDTRESRNSTVHIPDVHPKIIELMVMYMYCGALLELSYEEAFDLYEAADKYEVTTLQQNCASKLVAELTEENAAEVLYLADMHCDEVLFDHALNFISFYFPDVSRTSQWKYLVLVRTDLAKKVLDAVELSAKEWFQVQCLQSSML